MNLHKIKPHQNGKYEAPQPVPAPPPVAARAPSKPTIFPNEITGVTWRTFAYGMRKYQIAGAPASRYLVWILIFIAAIWATGLLPARWWGVSFFVLLIIALISAIKWIEARYFVRFDAEATPEVMPQRLPADEKLPIYATGQLFVEGKQQRYTYAPGFYRTFATGEHAVLCLIRDKFLLGVASHPEDETGMWYAFFSRDDIDEVRWGRLHFARAPHRTLAITYRRVIPASGRRGRDQIVRETLYLSFDSDEDARKALADLMI